MSPMLMTNECGTGLADLNSSPTRTCNPGYPRVDKRVTKPESVC